MFLLGVGMYAPSICASVQHDEPYAAQAQFTPLVPRGNRPQWVRVRGGAWVPTQSQLEVAQRGFKMFVNHMARQRNISLAQWRMYTFQYQGQLMHDCKVIFIKAYCSAPADVLHDDFLVVADGGPCYFKAWWSAERRSFIRIMFNGVA